MLKRAVNSVLKQTYQNFELIIVDNNSSDGTRNYLNFLEKQSTKIKIVFNETNLGGASARNIGVRHSDGDHLSFLDDDDEWHFTKLEKQIKMIEDDSELLYCGKCLFDNKKKSKYSFRICNLKNTKKSIMKDNFIGTTSCILIAKSRFVSIDGFDEKLKALQDYDLYIRLINNGAIPVGINEPLLNYFVDDSQNCISQGFRNFLDAAKMLNEKYKANKYHYLLLIRLIIIGFKKSVRSKRFIKEAMQYLSLGLFPKNL